VVPVRLGIGIVGFLALLLLFAAPFALATDDATSSSSGGGGVTAVSAAVSGTSATAVTTAATNVAGTTASGEVTNIHAYVGYEFKVTEYSNPSTGYDWQVVVSNPKVVAYNGAKAVDCGSQASSDGTATTVVGGGCTYAYYFKAIAEGSTYITMKYMRSWDSGSIAKVKQINVAVYGQQPTAATASSASPSAVQACTDGTVMYKYCCADGVMCKKLCKNGAYAEEKAESAECRKAVVTAAPVVTAIPMPTTAPYATVEIRMQKGWNLFSVPSTYASFLKTSCSRERVYHYNTAAGKYETSSLKSISGPKAHWFYSAEDCSLVFSEKSAYRKENYREELKAGWNMVGAPARTITGGGGCVEVGDNLTRCSAAAWVVPIKISDYKGTCDILAAYSFDTPANSWAKAETLEQKKGYFVKVSQDCKMYAPDEASTIPPLPE
jgi:predicted secreted protein